MQGKHITSIRTVMQTIQLTPMVPMMMLAVAPQ